MILNITDATKIKTRQMVGVLSLPAMFIILYLLNDDVVASMNIVDGSEAIDKIPSLSTVHPPDPNVAGLEVGQHWCSSKISGTQVPPGNSEPRYKTIDLNFPPREEEVSSPWAETGSLSEKRNIGTRERYPNQHVVNEPTHLLENFSDKRRNQGPANSLVPFQYSKDQSASHLLEDSFLNGKDRSPMACSGYEENPQTPESPEEIIGADVMELEHGVENGNKDSFPGKSIQASQKKKGSKKMDDAKIVMRKKKCQQDFQKVDSIAQKPRQSNKSGGKNDGIQMSAYRAILALKEVSRFHEENIPSLKKEIYAFLFEVVKLSRNRILENPLGQKSRDDPETSLKFIDQFIGAFLGLIGSWCDSKKIEADKEKMNSAWNCVKGYISTWMEVDEEAKNTENTNSRNRKEYSDGLISFNDCMSNANSKGKKVVVQVFHQLWRIWLDENKLDEPATSLTQFKHILQGIRVPRIEKSMNTRKIQYESQETAQIPGSSRPREIPRTGEKTEAISIYRKLLRKEGLKIDEPLEERHRKLIEYMEEVTKRICFVEDPSELEGVQTIFQVEFILGSPSEGTEKSY